MTSPRRKGTRPARLSAHRFSCFLLLFQFLMGAAFTTGTYIFLTRGQGFTLRPWSSFTLDEAAIFGLFIINAATYTLLGTAATQFNIALFYGSVVRGCRLYFDIGFDVMTAMFFVVLSLSLATIRAAPLTFFIVGGIFLALEACAGLFTLIFGTTVGGDYLFDILLDSLALGTGILLVWLSAPDYIELLIVVAVVWTILNTLAHARRLLRGMT